MQSPDAKEGHQTVLPGELSQAEDLCGEATLRSAAGEDVEQHTVLPGELSSAEPICGEETVTSASDIGLESGQILMPGELSQAEPLLDEPEGPPDRG